MKTRLLIVVALLMFLASCEVTLRDPGRNYHSHDRDRHEHHEGGEEHHEHGDEHHEGGGDHH